MNHYFKTKVVKMGVWALLPGDCETWHGQPTNVYFKKHFGLYKPSLLIFRMDDGFQHAYFPKSYFVSVFRRIDQINLNDYKGLYKKLKAFYALKRSAKKAVAKKTYNDVKRLSNHQLAKEFLRVRKHINHLAIFDQFAWIAEEYWMPKMESILVKKLGLQKNSEEYNRVLFALTKPDEISTTLEEKREVLKNAILIKTQKISLQKAAQTLAKHFGWMPVFCYGEPWTKEHYIKELGEVTKTNMPDLQKQYTTIKNHTPHSPGGY